MKQVASCLISLTAAASVAAAASAHVVAVAAVVAAAAAALVLAVTQARTSIRQITKVSLVLKLVW